MLLNVYLFSLQGSIVIQPDQMQVSKKVLFQGTALCWTGCSLCCLFLKDDQPHPDPDSGSYCGQPDLPSD